MQWDDEYDVIVIGSGMGGLTAASILTQLYQKKVLVLEKHYRLGGLTHTFSRPPGYQWATGLHYVGKMLGRSIEKSIFDFVTQAQMEWAEFPPNFDHFIYPHFKIDAHRDLPHYEENLIGLFKNEEAAIKQYFKDVQKVARFAKASLSLTSAPQPGLLLKNALKALEPQISRLSTQEYLDRYFCTPELKAVLSSQWGNYGIRPESSSFILHSIVVDHYLTGAFYPKNGSERIASSVQKIVQDAGGKFLTNAQATKIFTEDHLCQGVEFVKGKQKYTVKSSCIVSNVGCYNTSLLLYNHPISGLKNAYQKATSAMTVYLGLKKHPTTLGLNGSNYWFFKSYNHNDKMENPIFFSSSPVQSENFVAQAIQFSDFKIFEPFLDTSWRHRSVEYIEKKENLTQEILRTVQNYFPSLQQNIAYIETSTPLTLSHFTGAYQGSLYGLPRVMAYEDYRQNIENRIHNLYIAGVDAGFPGIVGAMMGGVVASLKASKSNFLKLLFHIKIKPPKV